MEPVTLLILVGVAAVVLGLVWVVARFFARLLKHVIFAAVIGVAFMLFWYQPFSRPARDPNVGKHAYNAGNDQYIGVVVGSAKDDKLGDVWIVKPPGGYETKYRKSRLILKDK